MIIFNNGDKPTQLPVGMAYNVNEKKYFSLTYKPPAWRANKEQKKGVDLVVPTTPNGLYYECISGGITGSSEPVFSTTERLKTVDGSVLWVAKLYDMLINSGDTITASVWTGTNNEVIDNASIISGIQTKFRLIGVAVGATKATLTNHITILRKNGDIEELDRSIIIPIKSL